jgi:hypothetical protein
MRDGIKFRENALGHNGYLIDCVIFGAESGRVPAQVKVAACA